MKCSFGWPPPPPLSMWFMYYPSAIKFAKSLDIFKKLNINFFEFFVCVFFGYRNNITIIILRENSRHMVKDIFNPNDRRQIVTFGSWLVTLINKIKELVKFAMKLKKQLLDHSILLKWKKDSPESPSRLSLSSLDYYFHEFKLRDILTFWLNPTTNSNSEMT